MKSAIKPSASNLGLSASHRALENAKVLQKGQEKGFIPGSKPAQWRGIIEFATWHIQIMIFGTVGVKVVVG